MRMAIYARVHEYCENWPVSGPLRLKLSRRRGRRIIPVELPNPEGQHLAEQELIALVMELLNHRCEGEYEQLR